MRNLNTNWYLIFAWSTVESTGVLAYHRPNASFTPTTVDIQKPTNLTNGRKTPPAPTSPPGDKVSVYTIPHYPLPLYKVRIYTIPHHPLPPIFEM